MPAIRSSCVALLLAVFACRAAPAPQAEPSPTPITLIDGPSNARAEGVWRTVLENFKSRAIRSEADLQGRVSSAFGGGKPKRSRIVLMARPGPAPAPYHRAWLDGLVADTVIDGWCGAGTPDACPDSGTTSFLNLADPQFEDDSSASVMVSDVGMDPTACRRHAGATMTGDEQMRVELRRRGAWEVVNARFVIGGSGFCGFTPTEQQRMARLDHEESLLRQIASPVAGTYRVILHFGATGDSSVLFMRTQVHPDCCGLRRTARARNDDRYHPLVGYYLSGRAATSVERLGEDSSAYPMRFWAVSMKPVAILGDSSVWRGEIDPLGEVNQLDPRAAVRLEARGLFKVSEDLRDSAWYFLPGLFVLHSDGRVHFYWRENRGQELVYDVVADRISSTVINK